LTLSTLQHNQGKEIDMNNLTWIGIVVWGLVIAGFGLLRCTSARCPVPDVGRPDDQHDRCGRLVRLDGPTRKRCKKNKIISTNVRYRTEISIRITDTLNHGELSPPYLYQETSMLYTIAVILVILWLLGLVTSYTVGGFIHILLVVAVIMILVRLISGRGI
jgi:hypothetical protein